VATFFADFEYWYSGLAMFVSRAGGRQGRWRSFGHLTLCYYGA